MPVPDGDALLVAAAAAAVAGGEVVEGGQRARGGESARRRCCFLIFLSGRVPLVACCCLPRAGGAGREIDVGVNASVGSVLEMLRPPPCSSPASTGAAADSEGEDVKGEVGVVQ